VSSDVTACIEEGKIVEDVVSKYEICSTSRLFHDCPLNLVKDRSVTWFIKSIMKCLLTSDFHPLSTPVKQFP